MARKKSNDTIYDTSNEIRKTDKHSGIYKITNSDNGKVYIGQSVNVFKRVNIHRTNLRRGVHGNNHLQLSWNKYGEDSFQFEIVEFCEEELLNSKECSWIAFYNSADKHNGYNSMIPDPEAKKFRHSKKTIEFLANRVDFTKEELLTYLHEFFYMEGRLPDPKDKNNPELQGYPKLHHFVTAFGTVASAFEEAGLSEYDHKAKLRNKTLYTKERVLIQFTNFIDEHGRFPNIDERQDTKNYDMPTHYVIKKLFGGMNQLRAELGYDFNSLKEIEKTESLNGLKKLSENKEAITLKTIAECPWTKSGEYYKKHFGSVDNALKLAGIDPLENKRKKKSLNK